MSRRTATWLAWSLCALSLALTALGLFLLVLNLYNSKVDIFDYWAEVTVMAIAFSIVGGVIATGRPENPIGWLCCVIGLVGGLRLFSTEFAAYSLLVIPGSLPGGELAAWILSWIWMVHLGLFVFLGLLFPNGLLPRTRWRRFAVFSAAVFAAGSISQTLSPDPIVGLGSIQNPLGVEALRGIHTLAGIFGYTLGLITAVFMFERLRYATGVEYQQLKWVTFASAVLASGGTLLYVISPMISIPWFSWTSFVVFMLGLVGVPLAMGIAILRYRLYNIDLIINKSLVYSCLTASLALLYLCCILVLQYLFRILTGQESQIAVVASTLTIAALFSPLRRRIQSFVDRRFYRRKYDASETLEAFGSRLRYETDLESISEDLLEVVHETMQPAHVSLWLPITRAKPQSQGDVVGGRPRR